MGGEAGERARQGRSLQSAGSIIDAFVFFWSCRNPRFRRCLVEVAAVVRRVKEGLSLWGITVRAQAQWERLPPGLGRGRLAPFS